MASDEMRKKWGTIFIGDREASVEQLNAMRERADHDKHQKEREEDYMERVRARAADRAREILGEAYAERQKVLDEAKGEAAIQKRLAIQECAKIKAEGEAMKAEAQTELARAQAELEKAAAIRDGAHEQGYNEGMAQAGVELQEFRAELGQSMATLMRAIERQRKNILDSWRNELVDLTQAAVAAGTGMVLQKEHEAVLRSLVYKSLDLLESRSSIACRVNPADEEVVSDLFRAARERFPELRQWTVSGDESIEPGGMVVESGTGSVDLRRENFRHMVDNILEHLGLPESEDDEAEAKKVASLVEQEVATIAGMTPEPDLPLPSAPEARQSPPGQTQAPLEPAQAPEEPGQAAAEEEAAESPAEPLAEDALLGEEEIQTLEPEPQEQGALENNDAQPDDMSLAELEEELFPLAGENEVQPEQQAPPEEDSSGQSGQTAAMDARILSEGGFL